MDYFYGTLGDLPLDRCAKLHAPSYFDLTLSILILVGILVSYLPQHWRIVRLGSSEGISPYFILLGTTSGTSALANILVLPASRADVACCKSLSGFECAAGLLGIAQVGVQWFCFTVILLLFLIFFPRKLSLPLAHNFSQRPKQYTWRIAVTVAILCLLHGLAVIIVSVSLILARPQFLGHWANALGIMATILAAIQYLPQIWLTWNLGHIGSLSIPMMLIQTPGSFLWSYSLFARLGIEGWSAWGVFLITGGLQGFLLVMGICFEIKARRAKDALESDELRGSHAEDFAQGRTRHDTDDEGGVRVEDENTPLITASDNGRKSSKASSKKPTSGIQS